jgi:hypothetical protein
MNTVIICIQDKEDGSVAMAVKTEGDGGTTPANALAAKLLKHADNLMVEHGYKPEQQND